MGGAIPSCLSTGHRNHTHSGSEVCSRTIITTLKIQRRGARLVISLPTIGGCHRRAHCRRDFRLPPCDIARKGRIPKAYIWFGVYLASSCYSLTPDRATLRKGELSNTVLVSDFAMKETSNPSYYRRQHDIYHVVCTHFSGPYTVTL